MNLEAPTVVVGAGPAGSSAAFHLASAGRPVVLIDRATFPRDKACGDGLTEPALRDLAAMGLDPAAVPSWREVGATSFVSPSGRELQLDTGRKRPRLAIAARSELDAALVELARRAGAVVHDGARLVGAAAVPGGIRLELDNGDELRAPTVVGADGAWSPLRRALEGPSEPRLAKWHSSRLYLEGADGPAAERAFVWFERDLLPGYAWAFPLGDGRVNVGVGSLRAAGGGGGWIVRRTDRLLTSAPVRQALGSGARPASRALVWPIPTEMRRYRLVGEQGRVLYVGDAADATDPMTGEGIAEALLTGRLAAEAIVSGQPARYGVSAWKALGHRHHRRARCSWLLRSPVLARAGLAVADAAPLTRGLFTNWVFG